MSTISQPPVLTAKFELGERIGTGRVIQNRRAGLTGPVNITPNPTWIRQIIQTGICSSDQLAELENGEQDAGKTVANLDALNEGKMGACWKVYVWRKAIQTGDQKAGIWTTKRNNYKIIWQQVSYQAPSFS